MKEQILPIEVLDLLRTGLERSCQGLKFELTADLSRGGAVDVSGALGRVTDEAGNPVAEVRIRDGLVHVLSSSLPVLFAVAVALGASSCSMQYCAHGTAPTDQYEPPECVSGPYDIAIAIDKDGILVAKLEEIKR